MAYPKKKKKGQIKKITPEMKKKARLGASGSLGLLVSGGGSALVKGARVIKGLVKKKVLNKMSKRNKNANKKNYKR